jgi:hypothetical protein
MSNGWRKLIIVEIIREQLELLTLILKLQQVHFIHVVSELDCVTTFYLRIDQMIAIFFYSKCITYFNMKTHYQLN